MNPFTPRTVADLTNDPPPPHLIQNVCRENGSILLYGKSGIGKSRLLWQLACGWAQGQETFGLRPLRPLRISFIEADMFRADFEAMVKELALSGIIAPSSLYWFSRDDATAFNVDGGFGAALLDHNVKHATDLTIYDAVPDIHLGDPNDSRVAHTTLRALHGAAVGRAYLGVFTQRKGAKDDRDRDGENVDELLGSQAWARAASTVWQMTNVPSLVWVKHRLVPKPSPIILKTNPNGTYRLKSGDSQSIILLEAAKGYASVNELSARIQAREDYKNIANPYKDRALRDLITGMLKSGTLKQSVTPQGFVGS